mgnify:CR=1 FL=1
MTNTRNNRLKWGFPLIGVATICLVATLVFFYIDKRPRPKTAADIVGSWVGVGESMVFTYRLDLRPDGTGLFGWQLTDTQPNVHRITVWRLDGRKLRFLVSPTEPSAEQVSLEGFVLPTRIKLSVFGINNRWKADVEMWNEEKVLRRFQCLKNAMEAVRRKVSGTAETNEEVTQQQRCTLQ